MQKPEWTAIGRRLASLLLVTLGGLPLVNAGAQELISNVPRNQTLIVENPEGTIKNAGWFNIWAINAGGQSTGLHQLAMDTSGSSTRTAASTASGTTPSPPTSRPTTRTSPR